MNRATTGGVAATLAAVALTATLSGCSGSHHPAPQTSPAGQLVATRWWSNSVAVVHSVIDPAHPTVLAARLHPSRTDYCGMLGQTVSAGKSILPGVTATDPVLATVTEAFVAELQAVAPAAVHSAWQTLGSVIVKVARSQGDLSSVSGVDNKAVSAAVATVAADAKTVCHVDLSS